MPKCMHFCEMEPPPGFCERPRFWVPFLNLIFMGIIQTPPTPNVCPPQKSLPLMPSLHPAAPCPNPNAPESEQPRLCTLTLRALLIVRNLAPNLASDHQRHIAFFGPLPGQNNFWTGSMRTPRTIKSYFRTLLRMPRMRVNASMWQRGWNQSSIRWLPCLSFLSILTLTFVWILLSTLSTTQSPWTTI